MLTFDAVVIGSGPAGLNASLYLVRAGLRTALIEKTVRADKFSAHRKLRIIWVFPKA